MHAVDLIASALGPDPEIGVTTRGVCCVTGEETDCVPRSTRIPKSFTAQALLRAPTSDLIGVSAHRALGHDPERKSSWWCDGVTFRQLRRTDVRDLVLTPTDTPQWVGYATTSYKKHGALMALVNSNGRRVWLFETEIADCTSFVRVTNLWNRLREMQDSGAPRPVLEQLDASPWVLGKVGPSRWLDFERFARPQVAGALYKFICYLLPSQEELTS